MSIKNFLNAVAIVFALFAVAWISRALFQSDPALLTSKLILLAPIAVSAFLLIRMSRRASARA